MFLFLSGFGCYHSLAKNSDVCSFLYRRIKRFLPAILIFVLYFILANITSIREITGYLTLENYWLDKRYFGYLSYAFLCYILSPYFYGYITKHFNTFKYQMYFLMFILFLTIPFAADNRIQGVARVPVFLFGMIVAYHTVNNFKSKDKIFKISCVLSIIAFINIILNAVILPQSLKYLQKAIYFYNLSLFAPGLCFCLASLFNKMKKNYITQVLSFIGKRSLEIFLIDSLITTLYQKQIGNFNHLCLSLSLGIIYSYLWKFFTKKCGVKFHEN